MPADTQDLSEFLRKLPENTKIFQLLEIAQLLEAAELEEWLLG